MNEKFINAMRLIKKYDNKETYPTFAYSILENYIPGQVFIEDSNRTALIGTNSGIFVVIGDPMNTSFNRFLVEILERRTKENKRFTLFSPSKTWDLVINEFLEKELRQIQRYSFHFNESKFSRLTKGEIPKEFKVRKIDQKIINNSQDFNEAYLEEYWESVSNFTEKGFGYCISNNVHLASECISIFASTQFAEMDIVTQNSYRGMGLAHNVAEHFILHCMEDDKIPRWDCDVNNIASINLAEKLGFENPIKYSVFVRM
ncbi:GNAT family N-acetyltransferase [Radiobacillus kanasensis]|uniref:GNAT family N-acetyltransferase n=1 Tax=Radiobacillus kanasensis TaxID=2844358 RepID=UPI001E2FF176|nr:GNAT family N-acetyltransferase [Radiobacillus kanasensis]UFU01147.1 GNAT family N-acetyltransferase [Radiobacillus kanasensis]